MRRSAIAFLAIFASLVMQTPAATDTQQSGGNGQAAPMAESASAFLATLTSGQRTKMVHRFDDNEARTNWSNLPSNEYNRDGLAVADLSAAQRIAFHQMLITAMSSQGYLKSATIMWLDDILRAQETRGIARVSARSSANYWIVMFGQPGSARWGWMISGHHLAANFTIVNGEVAFTPLFVGANPQVIRAGPYAGWRVLEHELVRGFALARSLTDQQRQTAVVSGVVTDDLFTGKGRKGQLKAMIGIPASQLTGHQQQLLWGLVREFVGSAADEAADAKLRSIQRDGLNQLHFAWWGSTMDPTKRFMYRIHSPSILIEYVREGRGSAPANHVHAIVRDPRNDYGEDWLGKHYQEQPHP